MHPILFKKSFCISCQLGFCAGSPLCCWINATISIASQRHCLIPLQKYKHFKKRKNNKKSKSLHQPHQPHSRAYTWFSKTFTSPLTRGILKYDFEYFTMLWQTSASFHKWRSLTCLYKDTQVNIFHNFLNYFEKRKPATRTRTQPLLAWQFPISSRNPLT